MRIQSKEEGLGCQSIYRTLGVMNGDVNFYLNYDHPKNKEDFNFSTTLVGSAALAIHADLNDINYQTESKDIDLYTNHELADLELFKTLPPTKSARKDDSQYIYKTSSASTGIKTPKTSIDIITNYEKAFGWNEKEANEIETLLQQETQKDHAIIEGTIDVHLPELETLKKTFQHSERNYEDRIELIENMLQETN